MRLDMTALNFKSASGQELRADCPFCNDRKGHLYVNLAKGVWHCVKCDASGWVDVKGNVRLSGYARTCRVRTEEKPYPSPDRLHEVYSTLIGLLGLSLFHRRHLYGKKRRMTPLEVAAAQYRTLPPQEEIRQYIAGRVAEIVDPGGIPGFFRCEGSWSLAGPPGLMIPVRDWEGRVRGFQIRTDRGKQKYVWFSSSNPEKYPGGAKVRVTCHVAGLRKERVWITEGPLKADIAAKFLNETVIAVPGVALWRATGLVGDLRAHGVKEAVIAYDVDAATNPNVAKAANEMGKALQAAKIGVVYAAWESCYKGIDDLLLAGREPFLLTPEDWREAYLPAIMEVEGGD